MLKKCTAIIMIALMLVCVLPMTASASTVVRTYAVGIALPVPGEKPDFTAEEPNYTNSEKITRVEWVEYDEGWEWKKDMTANDTFKEGYWYVVYIYKEAINNSEFSSTVIGYINKEEAKLNGAQPTDNNTKVSFYKAYQCSNANKEQRTLIKNIDLTVVNPVIGKTPTFAKVDTAQYYSRNYGQPISNQHNGVVWNNEKSGNNLNISNAFKADCTYAVTYILEAKDGYYFHLNNTKATINGKAAEVSLGLVEGNNKSTSLVVTLGGIVPGDGKKEVSSVSIYVTAPKDGEKPNYTKIDGEEYYTDNGINGSSTRIYKNGIAWYKSASSYISPGTTETFKGGTEYTVKLALTPKDGYKFAKSLTAKLNGKTAAVETFDDGSINISAKFTALSKEHKHTDSSWKTDKDNHWKICTDAACGTITVAKEAHKDQNKDSKCDICAYTIPKADTSTPSEPTSSKPDSNASTQNKPTASEPDTNETQSSIATDTETDNSTPQDNTNNNEPQEKDGNNGAWIWVVVALVALAGAAVVVVTFVKKKK